MTKEYAAEFCLFFSPPKKTNSVVHSKYIRCICDCLSKAYLPDTTQGSSSLWVESCCSVYSNHGVQPLTHDGFLLVKVPWKLLHSFATRFQPNMNVKNNGEPCQGVSNCLDFLTTGQTAWLAELALRSLCLDSEEFPRLMNMIGQDPDSLSRDHQKPTLMTLEQLGLVSEIVLRHDKAARRALWSKSYQTLNLFPNPDDFRNYFGDSVGFYFAWMKTYSIFMLVPVACGLVCFFAFQLLRLLHGVDTISDWSAPAAALLLVRVSFTLCMIIWSLVCTKLWSRQHASLVEAWSSNPLLEQFANDFAWLFKMFDQRPSYFGEWRRSPVTGLMERHFPTRKRRLRYVVSLFVIGTCLTVAFMIHVVLLNLEGFVTEENSPVLFIPFIGRYTTHGALFDPQGSGLLPYLPGVFHSLLVCLMNQVVFFRIAYWLSEWENHRSQEDFNRALIVKRFLFESLDAYGCLVYLGFVLCDHEAVRSLLLTMLTTDCVRRFLIECVIPFAVYRWRAWRIHRLTGRLKRAEDVKAPETNVEHVNLNRELCAESYEPFDDYLEMTLQHGYLVLFAHMAPFCGAVIAFLSIVIECHSDAIKLLWVTRRPNSRLLLRGHFIWLDLLAAQAWLSVLTNVGLLLVTLHSVQLDLAYGMWFAVLEHVLVLVGLGIHFFVNDVPAHVRHARLAREYKRVPWLLAK